MITLPKPEDTNAVSALSILRSGKRKPRVDEGTLTGPIAPSAAMEVGAMLRSGKTTKPETKAVVDTSLEDELAARRAEREARAEKLAPAKPVPPVTLEFNKKDGATKSVTIRKGNSVKVLIINRDTDDEVGSASL